MATPDAFHAHLDACQQCRDNPMGLCPTGAQQLRDAVAAGPLIIPRGRVSREDRAAFLQQLYDAGRVTVPRTWKGDGFLDFIPGLDQLDLGGDALRDAVMDHPAGLCGRGCTIHDPPAPPSDPVLLDLDDLAAQLRDLRARSTYTNATTDAPPISVEGIRAAVASMREAKAATPVADAGFLPMGPPFFAMEPVGSFADLPPPSPLTLRGLLRAREFLGSPPRWSLALLEAAHAAAQRQRAATPYATQADLQRHLGPPRFLTLPDLDPLQLQPLCDGQLGMLLTADRWQCGCGASGALVPYMPPPIHRVPAPLDHAAMVAMVAAQDPERWNGPTARLEGVDQLPYQDVTPQQLDVTPDDRAATVEERGDREPSRRVTLEACPPCKGSGHRLDPVTQLAVLGTECGTCGGTGYLEGAPVGDGEPWACLACTWASGKDFTDPVWHPAGAGCPAFQGGGT